MIYPIQSSSVGCNAILNALSYSTGTNVISKAIKPIIVNKDGTAMDVKSHRKSVQESAFLPRIGL